MECKIPLMLLLAVFMSSILADGENNKPSLKKIMSSLPPEERNNFVYYLLASGLKSQMDESKLRPKSKNGNNSIMKDLDIPKEQEEKFHFFFIPPDSKIKFVNWFRNQYNLTAREVQEMIVNKTCPHYICMEELGVQDICCPW